MIKRAIALYMLIKLPIEARSLDLQDDYIRGLASKHSREVTNLNADIADKEQAIRDLLPEHSKEKRTKAEEFRRLIATLEAQRATQDQAVQQFIQIGTGIMKKRMEIVAHKIPFYRRVLWGR